MPVELEQVRNLVRVEVSEMIRSGGLPVSALRVPRAKVTLNADVAIAGNTTMTLSWDGVEVYDHFGMHAPTVPDRLTVPDGGNYIVMCSVIFDPGAAGSRHIFLLHNGVVRAKFSTDVVSLVDFGVLAVAPFEARKGDYFQAQADNRTGTNETIQGGEPGVSSWFAAVKVA